MRPRHRRRLSATTSVALLLASLTAVASPASAQIQPTSAADCKIARAVPVENQPVSVGFPVHPDRLAGKQTVNVVVARFSLTDVPYAGASIDYTTRDRLTADLVQRLSRGTVTMTFTYVTDVYQHRRSRADWERMKANQHNSYGAGNESESTWGFVREALRDLDPTVDFTGVDTVVLQGPFDRNVASEEKTSVYEAMMTRSEGTGFFRPFATTEKPINNAFVMSGTMDWLVYAHELLHNFGLTDLYDSTGQVPHTELYGWSMFASNEPTLYFWERWQLGWIRDSEVVCLDLRTNRTLTPQDITLDYRTDATPKMIVLRTGHTSATVIELREPLLDQHYGNLPWRQPRRLFGQSMVTYSVHSDRWPGPIRLINQPTQNTANDFSVAVTRQVGDYEVHVIDAVAGSMRLGVWSASVNGDASALALKAAAQETLEKRRKAEQDARAAAEAEARAKEQAAATPTPTASPTPQRQRTITCVKGVQVKKFRGIKPKCPSGWRVRR